MLKTRNAQEGFFGAMLKIGCAVDRMDMAQKTWDMAMRAVFDETFAATGGDAEKVREFLDGPLGEAFAVSCLMWLPRGVMPSELAEAEIEAAVRENAALWQKKEMLPELYARLGMPETIPFLDAAVLGASADKDAAGPERLAS